MSLVSKTSSDLFATLLSSGNPEEVALSFIQKHKNDPTNMNVQLTDLIFRCCGINLLVNLPYESVIAEDVPAIIKVIESVSPSSGSTSSTPGFTLHKKYIDKALKFFENFWFLQWCENPNGSVHFIKKLILALSKVDVCDIQFFCIRILSKFITSLWINDANISGEQLTEFCDLIRKVMVGSFILKDRHLLKKSLLEFGLWLSLRPNELMNDNFLCFIVWSLKENTIGIIFTSLDILEGLVSNHYEDLPKRFLQQCGEAFSVMAITESDEIFARVCDCCSKIQSKFQDKSYDNITRKLTEHLFSFEDNKREAAGNHWISLNYDENNFIQSLRNMIHCIISFPLCLKFVDYFIDAVIDKCPALLTQWNVFAQLFVDKFEEKLTDSEKDILLIIIVYAAQRTVMNTKPGLCFEDYDVSTQDENTKNICKSITLAFVPHLECIFQLPCIEPTFLLKLMTYFNFDYMPVTLQKHLIKCCVLTFEVVGKFLTRRIAIELLWKMKMDCSDNISAICSQTIKKLRDTIEDQARNVSIDLIKNPEDFLNGNKGENAKQTFLALRVINAVVPITKKIAYDAAMEIVKVDIPALWNPAFMIVREVCVILSTAYILRKLRNESFETETQNVTDAYNLVLYFSSQLMVSFGRGGMTIFCSLCDIVVLFHEKNAIDLLVLNNKKLLQNINSYFRSALNESDEKNQELRDLNKCMMKKYLELIELNILPMERAYDALSIHCHQDHLQYDRILCGFLKSQCGKRGTDFMVTWMTKLWIRLYEGKAKSALGGGNLPIFEKLRDLIYPLRLEIDNFVNKCHFVGIDYATSDAENIEFAQILAIFSTCLSSSNRSQVLNYALGKASDAPAMQLYLRSLKTRANLKIQFDKSAAQSSPTTSSRASPVDADNFCLRDSSVSSMEDVLHTDIENLHDTGSESEGKTLEGKSSLSRLDHSEYSNAENKEGDSMEEELDTYNSSSVIKYYTTRSSSR